MKRKETWTVFRRRRWVEGGAEGEVQRRSEKERERMSSRRPTECGA